MVRDRNGIQILIQGSETPFHLRHILNRHTNYMRHSNKIKTSFMEKIMELREASSSRGDNFFQKILDNLQFDAEAELFECSERPPKKILKEKKINYIRIIKPLRKTCKMELDIPLDQTNILEELEYIAVTQVLEQEEHNKAVASERLGMSIRTLRNKINKYIALGWYSEEYRHSTRTKESVEESEVLKDIEEVPKRKRSAKREKIIEERMKASLAKAQAKLNCNIDMTKRATCCPDKVEWFDGMCLSCYKNKKGSGK